MVWIVKKGKQKIVVGEGKYVESVYISINIYNNLKLKYSEYLKPEITSIAIIQSVDSVWLELIELEILKGGLEKQTKRRINLDFITDGDEGNELFFNPQNPIEYNARRFIDEFSPYSIINITALFHDAASEKISKKYNTFGIDR